MKVKDKKKNRNIINSTREVILELVDAEKAYRTKYEKIIVINKLDLSIRKGDFISFLGVKGSGKTTMLQILSGIEKLDNGKMYFLEKDTSKLNDSECSSIRRESMGFLSEVPVLPESLSVESVLSLYSYKKEYKHKIIQLLSLENILNKTAEELTRFEELKADLARACCNNPIVLFIDESLSYLYKKEEKESILELIQRINRELDISIVLLTDDPNIAVRAQKVIRL